MSKLSEREVCTKFITPALTSAGWDLHTRIREEVSFTKGHITLCDRLKTDLIDARTRQGRIADTLIDATLAAA